MTSNNFASVAAVVQGIDSASLEALVSPGSLNLSSKKSDNIAMEHKPTTDNSHTARSRNRRASEVLHLGKTDGKRVSSELKCETCGKGYKHSSCLSKHLSVTSVSQSEFHVQHSWQEKPPHSLSYELLCRVTDCDSWEHTPEWNFTSKLLISKHQQVQLLEAASVLVQMNKILDGTDGMKPGESDDSSASPAASGSSELPDEDLSSVETTPPPVGEHIAGMRDSKRYSTSSSVYSQSYQSAPSASVAASSVPTSTFGSYHQGFARRPSTSGSVYNGLSGEDEAGLAAAVELCNFGTPRTGPTLGEDIPPVPPLPERYASHKATLSSGSNTLNIYQPQPMAPALTSRISDERVVRVNGQGFDHDEFDDRRSISRGHSDDYDDGFFGHMEE